MSEERTPIKLDFMTGLDTLPPRPTVDASTTQASLVAGRSLGFSNRTDSSKPDGRRLRSRGANTQLNLKVTAAEKAKILAEAGRLIADPRSGISNIGEFVVEAVAYYSANRPR